MATAETMEGSIDFPFASLGTLQKPFRDCLLQNGMQTWLVVEGNKRSGESPSQVQLQIDAVNTQVGMCLSLYQHNIYGLAIQYNLEITEIGVGYVASFEPWFNLIDCFPAGVKLGQAV